VRGGLQGSAIERVSAGSKKGQARGGSGLETRNVGASTTGCAGGMLGKGRWLTGGVHGPARADSRMGS
jgi:hypothetical protein